MGIYCTRTVAVITMDIAVVLASRKILRVAAARKQLSRTYYKLSWSRKRNLYPNVLFKQTYMCVLYLRTYSESERSENSADFYLATGTANVPSWINVLLNLPLNLIIVKWSMKYVYPAIAGFWELRKNLFITRNIILYDIGKIKVTWN